MTKLDDAYQELEALPPSDFDACARILRRFLELQGGRQDVLVHTLARTFDSAADFDSAAERLDKVRADWYREVGRKLPAATEPLPV